MTHNTVYVLCMMMVIMVAHSIILVYNINMYSSIHIPEIQPVTIQFIILRTETGCTDVGQKAHMIHRYVYNSHRPLRKLHFPQLIGLRVRKNRRSVVFFVPRTHRIALVVSQFHYLRKIALQKAQRVYAKFDASRRVKKIAQIFSIKIEGTHRTGEGGGVPANG